MSISNFTIYVVLIICNLFPDTCYKGIICCFQLHPRTKRKRITALPICSKHKYINNLNNTNIGNQNETSKPIKQNLEKSCRNGFETLFFVVQ